MHLTDEGMVYQGEGWTRASLPLRTCGSIVFVLPDEDVSLTELYADANVLAEALYGGTSTSAEISWSVPKIRIESTLELRDYLEEKIPTAFSMEADLSAMLKETSGYISDVRQKAYLEWDEEGVAAARVYRGIGERIRSADRCFHSDAAESAVSLCCHDRGLDGFHRMLYLNRKRAGTPLGGCTRLIYANCVFHSL